MMREAVLEFLSFSAILFASSVIFSLIPAAPAASLPASPVAGAASRDRGWEGGGEEGRERRIADSPPSASQRCPFIVRRKWWNKARGKAVASRTGGRRRRKRARGRRRAVVM